MHRPLKYIILTLFCVTTSASYGQTNNVVKNLLDSASLTKNARTIVLMETDTFVVLTTYKLFVDNCKHFIKEHELEWDKDLMNLFNEDKSKVIYADSLTKTNMDKSRLVFRMADLLESGQCLIYNKPNRRLEKLVKTEKYATQFVTRRLFNTKDNFLILKTEDGVF